MLTKVKKNVQRIIVFVLAVCMMAGSLTQTAKAASSGSLNEEITKIVDKQVQSGDTEKKKLKKLFAYVEKDFDYSRKTGFEAYDGWAKDYALEMLKNGKGSCYHYAAVYAFLAKKATGYSVRIGVGQTNGFSGSLQKHAWTEVKISGKWYICDTNMDKYAAKSSQKYCLKKRTSLKSTYNKFKDTKYYNVAL